MDEFSKLLSKTIKIGNDYWYKDNPIFYPTNFPENLMYSFQN